MALSQDEILRYSRHLLLPEVGAEGQEKLKNAKVLLVGCGGLGSPVAIYLSAAGVGRLGLMDFDVTDSSNLQRQVIYETADVGRPKVDASKDRIKKLNPYVDVTAHPIGLTSANVLEIFHPYDVIVDGSDNFPTHYLVNDACVLLKKPDIYGSVRRFEGQAAVFWSPRGPCYRCIFPEPPDPGMVPSCAEEGVLGILPGVIGMIQATETIKLILEKGEPLIGRYLLYNALGMKFREIPLAKDPDCPVCGLHPTILKPVEVSPSGSGACARRDLGPNLRAGIAEISAEALKAMADRHEKFILLDVREPSEVKIEKITGSLSIPLSEIASRAGALDPTDPIVVHCRSGHRSAKAIRILQSMGFKRLFNLKGGLLAYQSSNRHSRESGNLS